MSGDPIIGIDLGTSNSCVAVMDASGRAQVLADEQGRRVIPSVVAFHPQGKVLVGHDAKQRKVIDPKHTVWSFKRMMGRRFGSMEVTEQQARAAYQIKKGANEQPAVVTRAGEFTPPELSAILLDHIRGLAGRALGTEIKRAVVTVPANFNDAQRQATALAGEIAELVVVRVLNEPTAAALAYGHGRALQQTVAVYDFGGGTLDVTILALRDNVYEVLATAGDMFLGGDDIDEAIVAHMVDAFLRKERIDLRHDEMAMPRLRAVAEQVKIELSSKPKAVVTVQEIAIGVGGAPIDLSFTLTRDELVQKIAPIVLRSFPVCDEAFRLAGLATAQIDEVVLVGGTTKIPHVRDVVAKYFGKTPRTDVNPDEAVAMGAALQGGALASLLDKPARRATTQTAAAPPPIPAAAGGPRRASIPPPIPEAAARATLRGMPHAPPPGGPDPQPPGLLPSLPLPPPGTGITGDIPALPAPAIGRMPLARVAVPRTDTPAPVQEKVSAEKLEFGLDASNVETGVRGLDSGFFDPATSERTFTEDAPPPRPILLDVTPRGLCVGTVGGYCDEIIKRNAQIPIEQTRVFTTGQDNQRAVEIKVGQGESRRFDENTLLGALILEGLEPGPRGQTRIAVTFEIDTDGILQVSAVDERTQQARSARIQLLGVADAAGVQAGKEKLQGLRQS